MRIEADAGISEFRHVQRADTDQAGRRAGSNQIRIGRGGWIAPQHRRAGESHPPLDVEQILPADRHAVEGAPRRAVVLLNAAAALLIADRVANLREGMVRAAESIDSGKAKAVLTNLREVCGK